VHHPRSLIGQATLAFGVWLLAATTTAFAAGFSETSIPSPDGPIQTGIWYPSDTPVASRRIGQYSQSVAVDGEITARGLPLIVISHGSGGSFAQHYDTAIALADAGFVVASITHPGDNDRDQSHFAEFERRPRHITTLIDYMLGGWPQHDRIDTRRIGMFGFSAGGFTALVALGGAPDFSLGRAYCVDHPDDPGCRRASETGIRPTAPPSAFTHDPRIVAAVVAAPLGVVFTRDGLAGITAPIQLWRGDRDEILPQPFHAQHVYDELPVKPEYHVVANAGHFVFLPPCPLVMWVFARMACSDAWGFDRTAFHRQFNEQVVTFFKARLAN
jgi:predicted dienelactone hydrolase